MKNSKSKDLEFFGYIRLWRAVLLRSDIRLTPSDIVRPAVKEANIISHRQRRHITKLEHFMRLSLMLLTLFYIYDILR